MPPGGTQWVGNEREVLDVGGEAVGMSRVRREGGAHAGASLLGVTPSRQSCRREVDADGVKEAEKDVMVAEPDANVPPNR